MNEPKQVNWKMEALRSMELLVASEKMLINLRAALEPLFKYGSLRPPEFQRLREVVNGLDSSKPVIKLEALDPCKSNPVENALTDWSWPVDDESPNSPEKAEAPIPTLRESKTDPAPEPFMKAKDFLPGAYVRAGKGFACLREHKTYLVEDDGNGTPVIRCKFDGMASRGYHYPVSHLTKPEDFLPELYLVSHASVKIVKCVACNGTGRYMGRFGHNDPACPNCNGTGIGAWCPDADNPAEMSAAKEAARSAVADTLTIEGSITVDGQLTSNRLIISANGKPFAIATPDGKVFIDSVEVWKITSNPSGVAPWSLAIARILHMALNETFYRSKEEFDAATNK